ncbi:MAG: anaerobic ribonucleoside-triphosphate reductase activating protein [Candidatus Ruthia sp.]|nr:anaerobic ribonucleoside-triphosphate reductase activating protein [Candidatus Ruthturnera sp.]MBT4122344.1 anaerobic ribonucleoside-triphosphate reductase activating protein [Candidatus Ruthturnera sp.]MBT4668516.1 anaerobic ribonucleoside-triphosphate reductase activating protein [Candidatus Ruthturnera sp.]MBT6922890.1 anaerobic ribonucleoside-triphosphate reductase activating protein [Candidatus Ruthturnera sp.]
MTEALNIGGFEPLTTIDYPDNLSCVVFTQGCPWRCRYCHNHDLIPANKQTEFSWNQIFEFIKTRVGLLDAVVFSGGEPCLQKNLLNAIKQTKALGFKIGLHTGGAYPARLKQCLDYVDWVGFDIKHLPLHYESVTQTPKSAEKAWQSLDILLASGVDYQLRITKHPELINDDQLNRLKKLIKHKYNSDLTVQTCTTSHCLDAKLCIV